MKTALCLLALLGFVQAGATQPSTISGYVRLADGQPVAGARVALFDVTDLAAGAVTYAMTDEAGSFALSLQGPGRARPAGFALGPNYPNPFNPSTIIPYQLPVSTSVRLEVFNLLGQRVTTLVDGHRPAGAHTAVWDATDAAGQAVGAGVYFYRLSGGGATWTRKMVLLDGQAGTTAAAGAGWTAAARPMETDAPVYGLTVSGEGLVPYVDPAFRVEAGMAPVEVVVAAPARAKRLQQEDGLLGDVDGNGRVDIVDALFVAMYSVDASRLAAHLPHIALGDVNGDGRIDFVDAYLIGTYSVNPADPVLPAGIGERVSFASGGTPKMYWTDTNTDTIQRANLDGTQVENLITTGLDFPSGLALDVGQGKMYWTDANTDKIQRANLDGTQVENLVTTGLDGPGGLALDVGQGKMYWTDYYTDTIQRANLDGSQVENLITTGLEEPYGLALDVGQGKMYWTDFGTDKIQRANLDGSQVENLVTTGLEDPHGLALDVGQGKMYWTDIGTDKIQRANLDGSQVENLITTGLDWPVGLALDVGQGKMYWTDIGTDKIQRANLGGSQVENLVTTGLENSLFLALDTSGAGGGGGGGGGGGSSGPDLVVGSPSVSISSPNTGQAFTLSTTVRNQGNDSSASTTLRYYRSSDATINTSDTEVGTDAVSGLAAAGTSAESISLNAPSSAGTYYYGACVASVRDESNTDNNCSEGVPVTVTSGGGGGGGGGGGSSGPDLVVGSPSVSISSPNTGQAFTLSATVRNQGNDSSASTTLRYYRSSDATINTRDTEVGTDAVSGLAAAGTSSESISLNAPSSAGTYYYGACVASVRDESNTDNNCSEGVPVTVTSGGGGGGGGGGGSSGPDLVVQSPSVSTSSPNTGQSFTLSATIRNRGNGRSASTTLRYYRSSDATINTSDTEVGTDSVSGLAAAGTSSESISLNAPSSAGTYYYGACVASVRDESNTDNNCSEGVPVTVTSPDLIVESPSVSDNPLTAGQSFTLSATIRNRGNGRSASTTLRYYRSSDATINTSDTEVGTDSVSGLAAAGTSSESISLNAPSSAGTYYYGACVASVRDESNTDNNCSEGVPVTVTSPDLIVESPSVSDNPLTAGQSFTLSATIRNRGNGRSASTTLRYYRSSDATINTSDTEVGTDSVSGLAAAGTSPESISLNAPSSAGTYYYGACVASVRDESNTDNNCSEGVPVTVTSPDLIVESPSVSDNPLTAGQSFTLSATVRNRGNGRSASTTLRYYRSSDATINTSDTEVGTDAVSRLAAAGTSAESISLNAPSSAGTYYYGACVASVRDESNTDNNCSEGVPVTVTSPDLIVESPSVSISSPNTGQSFTLSTTVRNRGNGSSASTTLRYYRSSDATISTRDTEVGTDSVSGLAAAGTSAESISLNAPSSAGTYYYGACVASVRDESNTDNNCSEGVPVTVTSTPPPSGGACYVGQVVRPNESCTFGGGEFRNVGDGCIVYTPFGSGTICSNSININGLQATRSGNNFTIEALP